jgi:hypothetical protein
MKFGIGQPMRRHKDLYHWARPLHGRHNPAANDACLRAALASRKLARPVKWQEDRSEGFVSDNQGRDHSTRAELALDENDRFLGLRVSIHANLGAPIAVWLLRPDTLDRPHLWSLFD